MPYNRVTSLDVRQEPVTRSPGISTILIQAAGYSGQAVPEIRIEDIQQAEELRGLIRSLIRQSGTTGNVTGGAPAWFI